MPHFFIKSETINNGFITISDKENYRHIAKSLRAKTGEDILLIDQNQIQHEGIIEKITSNTVEIKVTKSYKSERNLDFELYLAQSPLKSDSQNLIIEKATELGIEGVFPVLTDNCSLKKSVIEQKISKWQKIMQEASKQCERAKIPTCFELSDLEKLSRSGILARQHKSLKFDRILAFVERDAKYKLKDYLGENPLKKGEKILVIIGPEGGFSPQEFEFFKTHNITTLSLGNLILKAETAVITALGNLVL